MNLTPLFPVIGAKVHGVETIPTRLVTGGQEMLGPEATFVYNDREKNQGREYWRVNIRLVDVID